MNYLKKKAESYERRKHRVNAKIKATSPEARVIVERSNMYISAQVVDQKWHVVATIHDKKVAGDTKTQKAENAWSELAKIITDKGLKAVAFDRNGYLYHGRVKAFAEGLRKGGLTL